MLKSLPYRAPYDWAGILAFLAPRAIPGIEAISMDGGGVYRRALPGGALEVSAGDGALVVRAPGRGAGVAERVRRLFDLDADPEAIGEGLARAGGPVARLARARPGVRVPGAWDPFETAVRVLLGQQVSVAAATTLAGRLAAAHGGVFPTAAQLAAVTMTGMPRARAEAIRAFAAAVASGELALEPGARLLGRPGIGPWTAGAIAMRCLGDRDAFPDNDLVLRRATGAASALELRRVAEGWRPYRAYAAMLLWLSGG